MAAERGGPERLGGICPAVLPRCGAHGRGRRAARGRAAATSLAFPPSRRDPRSARLPVTAWGRSVRMSHRGSGSGPRPCQPPAVSRRRAPCCASPCRTRVARRTAPRDAARGRLPPRPAPRELVAAGPGQRRRVLLPAPPRHRDLRRLGPARRRHHRPRPAAGQRGRADEILELGFGPSTFRFAPARARARRSPISRASASPLVRRACSRRTSPSRGVDAERVRLDGAVETAVHLGVADAIADVVATGPRCAQAGLEIVGEPILESEAVLVRRRGAPELAAGRPAGAPAAGRHHRPGYVLMDYDITVDASRRRSR